eukprot:TRINITY_DN3014_c1_g2_i1.p2 TRINITY_DN3014_c1_g2~~TRINITY_DN3014_c1_g2_i1.p2  ORF type:complete len:198 (-),score=-15.33 TRINITY_DN3014_c1_g2_i1:194-724(-)
MASSQYNQSQKFFVYLAHGMRLACITAVIHKSQLLTTLAPSFLCSITIIQKNALFASLTNFQRDCIKITLVLKPYHSFKIQLIPTEICLSFQPTKHTHTYDILLSNLLTNKKYNKMLKSINYIKVSQVQIIDMNGKYNYMQLSILNIKIHPKNHNNTQTQCQPSQWYKKQIKYITI